jgi:hypothetical protein
VSDAEAVQDHVDEQGTPEAPRDDYEEGDDGEQALAILNASTEENSAIENGVGEGNHNTEGGQDVENEDSDVEDTTQAAENREETEGDINAVKLIEEQQGTATAHHSGEGEYEDDDDRESVSGNTEPPENGNEGM